jgi:hypothetical protein
MTDYTKYNHLAESGTGAAIVAYLALNVHRFETFSRYQKACSQVLSALPGGDEHPWNVWLDELPGGDLQYEALCRAAHNR